MEKGKIVTHSKSDSSRVVLNNKVYENISNTNVEKSPTEGESVTEGAGARRKQVRLESGQAALVPRQYRNVNQKEQLLFNTLEKNLTRQKHSALQSQDYSMQKYKQRLAGYERLRMSGGESISGSIPSSSSSELLFCSDRHSGSKAVYGKSTNTPASTSLTTHGDQSIGLSDVNRTREAGLERDGTGSDEERQARLYNVVITPCDSQLQQHVPSDQTGVKSLSKDSQSRLISREKSKSFTVREPNQGKKKLRFASTVTEETTMLRKPDSLSCSPPDTHLLSVDEAAMRPRANTDPTSDGKTKTGIKLPEITIEDCSDPDDKANSDEGMFTVFASPPRRRANTCPEEFFNRRRKGRPPTPPPTSRTSSPTNKFSFGNPLKSPVSFVHHKLSKVSEDTGEAGNSPQRSSGHVSRQTTSNRRSSLNTVSSLRSKMENKLTLKESEPQTSKSADNTHTNPGNGRYTVTKPEATKISDNNKVSGLPSQGQDVSEVYSSKDCRFSQKISPTLDGKPLEAC